MLPDERGNSYFPRWLLNSFILSASIVVAQLFFCSIAAFAFARLHMPGKGIVFAAMLSTMMIPGMVLMIPKYQILNALHGRVIALEDGLLQVVSFVREMAEAQQTCSGEE